MHPGRGAYARILAYADRLISRVRRETRGVPNPVPWIENHPAAWRVMTVALMTSLAGWSAPAGSTMSFVTRQAVSRVIANGFSLVPPQPKPFTLPAQPIEAASSDGYLPSSWSVTPKGAFSLSVPLEVPPGRAGMAPVLSLEYASSTGNGVAGVGWLVAGFSTITRGGRVWARHGATDGVDFSARDRFYLDGQELVGVDATPYGGNGAEYRTEPDTFVRVRSTSAAALDPKGPEQFTVELGDGRVRTYTAVEAEQVTFDPDNQGFTHAPARARTPCGRGRRPPVAPRRHCKCGPGRRRARR